MIYMLPLETLHAKSDTNNALSVNVYAILTTNADPVNAAKEHIAFIELALAGTEYLIFKPAIGTFYDVINIVVANSTASPARVTLWHVEEAGITSDDNLLCFETIVPANGTLTLSKMGVSA